jgi:3-hydroxybutyryl-CoA dehydratase
MKCLTMEEIEIGQKASFTKQITEGDVFVFAGATGDLNPIHVNEEYAKNTKFGTRIAHGLISASLIGAALGNELPGEGSIYVSQEIKFKAPVFLGDTITAELEVINKEVERNRLTLTTTCKNQDGIVVIEGIAVTMPAKSKRV